MRPAIPVPVSGPAAITTRPPLLLIFRRLMKVDPPAGLRQPRTPAWRNFYSPAGTGRAGSGI